MKHLYASAHKIVGFILNSIWLFALFAVLASFASVTSEFASNFDPDPAKDGTTQTWTVNVTEKTIAPPATVTIPYRINVAGQEYSRDGVIYGAEDAQYLTETLPTTVSSTAYTPYVVEGGHQDLYYPRRYGPEFSYSFPVTNGNYRVVLHMVENYQTATDKRIFDVSIENDLKIDNLDLFAIYGKGALAMLPFDVVVTDGSLDINFLASVNNAIVQAIEVVEVPAASSEKDILSIAFAEATTASTIDNDTFTITAEVANNADLTALAPVITVSEGAGINPQSGVAADFSGPVDYTVTAEDGSTQTYTVFVTQSAAVICSPISTLPCDAVVTTLPVSFDFSSSISSTLQDINGAGTGFTAVMEHSEARRTGDLPVSNPQVNGYEPSLLNLNGGMLQVQSQAGIAFLNPPASSNNNNQVNTLGVGLQNISKTFTIESRLLQVSMGGSSAQAGIWFGFDEDNFVKLAVLADAIELRKEVGGKSDIRSSTQDQIIAEGLNLAGKDIRVKLVIDPVAKTITGFYAINDDIYVQLTKTGLSELALPQSYLTGRNLSATTTAVSFAGIYATHRNGTQFTTNFDSFSVSEEAENLALAFSEEDLNFNAEEGATIDPQTVSLSASSGNPTFTLSEDPDASEWLILPKDPQLGELQFSAQQGLPVGSYSTSVFATASDGNYASAQINIFLEITASTTVSGSNAINAFTLVSATGDAVINSDEHTVSIEVANGTDLTDLAPAIAISDGATINPASETAQDFSVPVQYTVTAEDTTVQIWTVTITEAAQAFAAQINFQDKGTVPPVGYLKDYGKQFGFSSLTLGENTYTYGWKLLANATPFDASDEAANNSSGVGRNRLGSTSYANASEQQKLEGTLVHFQGNNIIDQYLNVAWAGQPRGNELFWEMEIPNGVYDVTISLGDGGTDIDSRHSATVEGYTVVPAFVPAQREKRNATITVAVTDGLLTINGLGGFNSKINYINVVQSTGTPVSGELAFDPASLSKTLAPDATGTLNPTLSGEGAGDIGLVIQNNVTNRADINSTGVTDWLSIPETGSLGEQSFAVNATGFASGVARNNKIIASAKGFKPAVLDASLTVAEEASGLLLFSPESIAVDIPSGTAKTFKVNLNNSDEDPLTVTLLADADGTVPAWLTYEDQLLSSENQVQYALGDGSNEILFGIDATNLTTGTYTARITASLEGYQTGILDITLDVLDANEALRPYVTAVRPQDGAVNVSLGQSISVDLQFPSGKSFDGSTVNPNTVMLFDLTGGERVAVTGTSVNGSAGGDAITLTAQLKVNTTYEFEITDQVKDANGYAMVPFTSRFATTSSATDTPTDLAGISFTQQILVDQDFGPDGFTSLVVGPDHKLYGATSGGKIERWDIAEDGTLINHITISPFGVERRLLIGLKFTQDATAQNLVAWISHSHGAFENVPDWTGKISKIDLNNPTAPVLTDYVVNLPRSSRDHSTNNLEFGPDGALYFPQGSNSAMGAPDNSWGNREEHLLSAAIMRLDIDKAEAEGLPLDVKTENGGTYDPYAFGAPLTIYASGTRNAYDLVWHSNGQLYVPTNGSAAGGNTPTLETGATLSDGTTYTGPRVTGLNNVRDTQNDYLYRIIEGKYYGSPNPKRNEYILNGGNPTAGVDPGEVVWGSNSESGYPVGTQPDPNFGGWAYDFGLNKSPNGAIEYKSNAFGGKLKGKLLVCRFSGGDDIIVLEPGQNNLDIIQATEGIAVPGLYRPFANPLDVTEDPLNGNLYISEYFDGNGDGKPRITLLKADVPAQLGARIAFNVEKVVGDAITAGNTTFTKQVEITNDGDEALTGITATITGANASEFSFAGLPTTLAAGAKASFNVVFDPSANGTRTALLSVSGTNISAKTLSLHGLGKTGTGGANEPSLQAVLDTYFGAGQITTADTDPASNQLNLPAGKTYNDFLGDELDIKSFERVSNSPVTLEVLSIYGPEAEDPVTAFGWYKSGDAASAKDIFTVSNSISGNGQTLNPVTAGALEFAPGDAKFGFFSRWPFFNDRVLYSEDALNTFAQAIPHHVRVYAVPGEENAYIIATEEHISGFDYQDIVVVVRNIQPADTGGAACSPISTLACDELEVSLPFALDFSGSEGGLAQTGFTMVDNPSARIAIDGTVSNPNVVGFEPGRISFANGKMILNAAHGIAYLKNGSGAGTSSDVNSQINSLGVGIKAAERGNFSIKTTIVNPYTDGTSNSEQAGLWFGLNEDNYVKLVTSNPNTVQLLTEINAVSDNTANSVRTENITGLHTSTVGLRLYVDMDNNLLTGYYSLNGDAEVEVGSLPLPATFVAGNANYDDTSFAGVFTTKRRELNATVNYTFENFSVVPDDVPVVLEAININFSDPLTEAPLDYVRDAGQPYGERGNGQNYGWRDAQTSAAADLSLNGRNREIAGLDVLSNTLVHMQYGNVSTNASKGYLPDAKWEIDLQPGMYSISVTVGDPDVDAKTADIPKHTINAEGINLIDQFIPSGTQGTPTRFMTAGKKINVIDGRLTIDANGGYNTKISSLKITPEADDNRAYFVNVTPENNATNVGLNDFQTNVELVVPIGYELDKNSLAGNVNLYEVTSQGEVLVPSNSNDTGGGDAITLTPSNAIKEFTTYVFRLTSAIEANRIGDVNDRISFQAFESRFTTGSKNDIPPPVRDLAGVEFSQVRGASLGEKTTHELFSSLTIGPDGKLYASTLGDFGSDGKIQRWDIAPDGTLTNLQILSPELTGAPDPVNGQSRNNQNRLIIGLTFDPSSTADNLIAYVTHSKASITDGPDWDGMLTRLSGPILSEVQDLIIHLPRSAKDHLTNSIAFDPSGNMYISQGSNTAGGQPDPAWNYRSERLLAGAVLKIELNKLPSVLPLDAYTTDNISVINSAPSGSLTMSDGTYNPYATNSPVTIFATGIRNAYDLVWHSNGWLYVPTNGTAGNNRNSPNTPSTNDYPLARRIDGRTDIGSVTGITGGETQKDWLFKTKGGSYHGHPNPYRGEYILNHGGKPYSGLPGQAESSYRDVAKYPTTVGPDPNYSEPAYDFGKNKSPNGVIEYKSEAFGGKLKGLLMVVRFSGQDDLLVMDANNNGDIAEVYNNIPGLGGFDDPLDVVEDVRTGNIYVSEYDRDGDGLPQLTLLRASDPASTPVAIAANPEELIFEATTNENEGGQSDTKIVEVTNTSTSALKITGATISGAFADQFELISPLGAVNVSAGESVNYKVTYAPDINNDNLGYQNAMLTIASDAVNAPNLEVGLYALKKSGFEGGDEPWLQDVVDALGIGVNVGWKSLENGTDPNPVGDEMETERWVKLSADLPVVVTPVGRYSPAEALPFGWYTRNGNIETNEVGVLKSDLASAQTLFPKMENEESSVDFDPKGSIFGLYVKSNIFGRFNYTEDAINTGGVAHRARIYPNKDRKGNTIPNSYLIAFEDAANGDYQDYIFILDNVVPSDEAVLAFEFDPTSLEFEASIDQQDIAAQEVTITATGGVTPGEASLTASENWVVLPDTFTFGSPLAIGVNPEGLGVGMHQAVVTVSAPNYASAELNVSFGVTNELVYVYQFNFQSPDNIALSPEGYIDDIGKPFGIQHTTLGNIEYGWVLPKTNTPADAGVNARNRNDGNADDAVLKTFTIIGHTSDAQYPLRDWVVNLPNGSYSVNISVGEAAYADSNHVLDVNGVTVVDFDQENNNPENRVFEEGTKLVEVTDGTLRLSLNPRGVNAKPNYIRIAPINTSLLPPAITAVFDGLLFEENVYRGAVNVTLTAEDRSDSGSIVRLDYRLDDAEAVDYAAPFAVSNAGDHQLIVEAEDANGNVATKTYDFTIQEPSGALLFAENRTKIPGTDRAFPANDYMTFHRLRDNGPNNAKVHDNNTLRLNNTGTGALEISEIVLSNTAAYTYEVVGEAGNITFPMVIAPGSFKDLKITFIKNTGGRGLTKATISIVSNADNNGEAVTTLNGAYMLRPEGNNEITAQEVFDSFGFTTKMLSIVNDAGTITPKNRVPTRPSSNYPSAANIDAGYEGDMILSNNFVQADPTKPVRAVQLSALHGPGSNNAKLVQVNGKGTVGGFDVGHNSNYYQTLLPNNNAGLLTTLSKNTINGAFRIAVSNYLTSGGNNLDGRRPDLLGARVYKAIDRDGNVIPNEYIVLQDFIQDGCGAGSANCDWNDNTFYFINVRPEAVPTALPIDDYVINVGTAFDYDVSTYFDKGYPGNKLSFELTMEDGSKVPDWMVFDPIALTFSGTAPTGAKQSYLINVSATDLNGLTADTQVNFIVTDPSAYALRINAGGPTVQYDGKEFVKDLYFKDGAPYFNTKVPLSEMFKSERSEAKTFGYEVPVPNGNYTVTLHFAEIYWGATGGGPGGKGKRIFDVNLEGGLILDNYDIFADVGAQTAVAKTFVINLTDGILNLDLSSETNIGGKDFPMLSGLEIIDSALFNNPPQAIASADVTSGKAPLAVIFTGSASTDDEAIAGYLWDFGNGETATEIDPTYTFADAGEYNVSLTVTDAEGLSGTANLTITVINDAPVALATADINEGKADLTVNFDGSASTDDVEIASYLWDFGNGTTSNEVAPAFTYTVEGTYEVTLTVTDNKGLETVSEALIINVAPRNTVPVAVAEANVTSGTLPLTIQFTGSNSTDDSGVVSYQWDFDNGQTSLEADPEITFTEEGNYNVLLLVYDEEGAFDFDIINIVVGKNNTPPIAVINGGPFSGNAPLFVEFMGSNSQDDKGVTAYLWNFGDGATATEQNPSHRYDIPGDYIASLKVYDAEGLTGSVQVLVRANRVNGAPIAVAKADVTSGASPLNVRFDGTGSSDDSNVISSYSWKLNNNEISSASTFDYRFNNPGSYNVELTVTDDQGLSNSDTILISVDQPNTAPVAAISADKTSGKAPLTVNFTGAGSQDDKGIVSYAYSINGTQVSSGTEAVFTYQFTEAGTYNVQLTVTDAENATDNAQVQINVQEADPNGDFALRINAGGPEVVYDGNTFVADQNFKGGKIYVNDRVPLPTLFKTERSADTRAFGYDVPVANGNYTVNLYFAEIYWGATGGGSGGTGKRVFDVKIEGALVLDDLDINREVGPQKVLVRSFDVTITDGRMNLDLSALSNVGGKDQPKLSGLEILAKKPVNTAPNAIVSATPLEGEAPLEVSFTGSNSTDDEGVTEYLWTFKGGSTSVESDPKFTFAEAGSYKVTLQVEDAEGLKSSADVTIKVTAPNAAPIAVASATPLSGTAPLNVTFTGENSTDDKAVASYTWNFGDGGTSTEANPAHVYQTVGTYNATLKIKDAEGLESDSAVVTIVVNATVPTEDFALYLNTGSNDDLQFEGKLFKGDVSMPGIYNRSYVYVNNDASSIPLYKTERGTPADKLTLSYSIPVPNGKYIVSTYHNELYWGKRGPGGSGRRVFDISMEGKLVKDNLDLFKESGNQPVKLTFEVTVTDGVLNIDMPPSVNRPTISGLAIEAVVNQKPTAIATATPKSGTAPLLVKFDGTGSTDDKAVTEYLWQFEPGRTSTEAKPSHTFNSAGSYPVKLTVTDAGGLKDTTTLTIDVQQSPVQPDVAMYINTGSSKDVNFDGKTFVGDVKTPSLYDSKHTYENTNASSIPLYQSERGSELDKGTLNFSIPVPNGTYTVSTYHNEIWWGKSGGAAGAGKRVFDLSIEGDLVKDDLDFFKEFNNKPTKLTFANITVTDGVLNIKLKASVDRPSISGIAIEGLSQNTAPIAIISTTPKTGAAPLETSFTGSGSTDDKGIVGYYWDFNDGTTSTEANPKHVFVLAGTYNVSLKVTDTQGATNTVRTTITAQGCNTVPAPWMTADIGQVAAAGSTCYQDGTFNVQASGADIWSVRDEFHYVYRKMSGDVEIIARVNGIDKTNDWAKAGVMIRGGLENNAQHAFMFVAPNPRNAGGPGYAMQNRTASGGSTSTSATTIIQSGLPMYVRLVRNGNTIRSYVSRTRGNWKLVASRTINMGTDVYIGLATTSHKDGALTKAVYDDVSVTGMQTNAIAAAPLAGQAPLAVDFNGAKGRSKEDASLRFFWDFKGGTTSTEASPSHTFEKAGTYDVELTVKEGKQVLYTSTVAIDVKADELVSSFDQEELEPFGLSLYPNPASAQVNLEVKGAAKEITSITIFDMRGRQVQQIDAAKIKVGDRYPLDITNLQAGVYMVRIADESGTLDQQRLVVKDQ